MIIRHNRIGGEALVMMNEANNAPDLSRSVVAFPTQYNWLLVTIDSFTYLLTHSLTHSLTNYFTTHDDEVYSCDSSTGKARNGSRSGEEVQVECEWQCGGGQQARGGGEQAGGTVPDGE
jgi:hypothetical protein